MKNIRKLDKEGTKQIDIARKFSVSAGYISRIISKDVWNHV